MKKDTKFLISLVKRANKLITDEFVVEAKDDKGDLITNFDIAVEKFIIKNLKIKYPDFNIVSEEFNGEVKLSQNCFVIDPIDGTINFAYNIPLWVIQIAMIKNGQTVAAVVYAPKLNELYWADSDGAFLNGKRISVSNYEIKRCIFAGGSKNLSPADNRIVRHTGTKNMRCMGSAGVHFAWVASGRLGGTYFRKNTVWDYLPGQYLVEMAGGKIYNEDNFHLAANSDEFLEVLKKEARFMEEDKI